MMKTRLSAEAAVAMTTRTQASSAGGNRMVLRSFRRKPRNGRSKRLIMINRGRGRGRLGAESGRFATLDGNPCVAHVPGHERYPRYWLHLPRDYEQAISWQRSSINKCDYQEARPEG